MKHWKTIVVIILMLLAMVFNWNWFWAVLLFFGLIHHMVSGEIHFVELITKKDSPVLYYSLLILWSVLTYYSIQSYFSF